MRFSDRIAIVTGAGSGIGRATGLALAREGAGVVLVGRTRSKLEATAREISGCAPNAKIIIIEADVAQESAASQIAAETLRSLHRIDILINSAGVWRPAGLLDEAALEVFDSTIGVNLRGVFLMTRAVAAAMVRQHHGSIVNIASVAGVRGFSGSAAYAASKAAVINLTQSLAAELAPHGIRVNAIAAGNTATPMNAAVRTPEYAAVYEALRKQTPTGRVYADPEEIAALALFLAGDDARTLVGSIVVADEGLTAAFPPIL